MEFGRGNRIIATILAILGIGGGALYVGAPPDTTPVHLRLKVDKSELLGEKTLEVIDGKEDVVKYAYRTNVSIVNEKNEDISKRTKRSKTFDNQDGTFTTEIISGVPQYYKDGSGNWWQAEYATTTREEYTKQTRSLLGGIKKVFAQTTDTFYPDADSETTSVDGVISTQNQTTWDNAHDDTNATIAFPSSTGGTVSVLEQNDASPYWINRAYFLFDTSSLPDNANISSASLNVYLGPGDNDDNDGDDYISIVTSNPASNTNLVTTDFDDIGTIEQHDAGERVDVTIVDGQASQYYVWDLNSTGVGNISLTGVTKFGMREGHDLIDSELTVFGANTVNVTFAETSGTSQDPYLEVTYTVSTGEVNQQSLIWFD